LVTIVNDPIGHCDFDLGGLNLASLVLAFLASTCNPLGHNLHVSSSIASLVLIIIRDSLGHGLRVDCCFPSPS